MKKFLRKWLGIDHDYGHMMSTTDFIRENVRDIRFGKESSILVYGGNRVTHKQAIEAILSHLDVRIIYEPATPPKVVILPKMYDDGV